MSEFDEQVAVVTWFRMQYPEHCMRLIASGNGLHIAGTAIHKAIKWRKFRDSGGVAGVADLFLAIPAGRYHGLWVEMKYGKNTVTDEQNHFLSDMADAGYAIVICYSAQSAIDAIKIYLKYLT